jgi:hypothetical protein
MYQEFKQASNYQALQDTQINKIIAAQQRRYNPSLLGDVYQEKPSNLYQQYLNETGLINAKTSNQFENKSKYSGNISGEPNSKSPSQYQNFKKNYQDIEPPLNPGEKDNYGVFNPKDVKAQPLPQMQNNDYYAGKPNEELPRSVYSNHVNQPLPSRYGKPNHHLTEKLDYKLRSNNDDYSYVDTYEMDKKRANQNYSNLLGRKLGDPSTRPEEKKEEEKIDIMGRPQKEGTLEYQRMQKGVRNRDNQNERLFPSLHYTEFKDNRPQRVRPDPLKNRPQDMNSRANRMIEALRNTNEKDE